MESSSPLPPSTQLARLPTPLQQLNGKCTGTTNLWLKRDDMTGIELSGNKVRKLEFLMNDALSSGSEIVLTCGGIQSNHARATALSAAQLGLKCHLLLRGQPPEADSGNQFLGSIAGADVTWLTPEEYQNRDEFFERVTAQYKREGRASYVIPEGGSNALGVFGYVTGYEEMRRQLQEQGVQARHVYTAVGSGGTLAGLLAGWVKTGRCGPKPIGIPVCDDAAYFTDRITTILENYRATYGEPIPEPEEIELLDGWVGLGYARSQPHELELIRSIATLYGFFLDPVYTVKGWMGMIDHRSLSLIHI